jgi:hypothetical protein
MSGSPLNATDGTQAAQDLLDPNNPYFYQPYRTDPYYHPEQSKAEAFLETLNKYEQAGDTQDIAQLLNTLYTRDPKEAGKLFQDAENLQGTQIDSNGIAFANNQADIEQVLGKALQVPGVNLGDPTKQGTLAYDLLHPQPGSGSGVFGSNNGALVPQNEYSFLQGLNTEIDDNLNYQSRSIANPATGSLTLATMGDVYAYLSGKKGNANETPQQRLANLMNVLGPQRTYAVLTSMPPDMAKQFGIQDSLNKLVASGRFTAADAKQLALDQANYAITEGMRNLSPNNTVESFINALPNDPNGQAVKFGYAEGSVAAAQQLAQALESGKYKNDGAYQDILKANLDSILANLTQQSAGLPDPLKTTLFSELHAAATQVGGTQGDILNAYAANILGSLNDKSQIAAILRGMGGVGVDGTIDPTKDLGKFLQSALNGQADLGLDPYKMMTPGRLPPGAQVPQGVASLLNALSGSGDTKLEAGTLHTVMQWSIDHPGEASVLAAQDTGKSATGYRTALMNLFDKSFDQLIQLDPDHPGQTLMPGINGQVVKDLQVLSAIEMGPPFDDNISSKFAFLYGQHAAPYLAYAADPQDFKPPPTLSTSGDDTVRSAAYIGGQLLGAFNAGVKASFDKFQDQIRDTNIPIPGVANNQKAWRLVSDFDRGIGTGLLLGSSIKLFRDFVHLGEKTLSIMGRIGLFTGSALTIWLDWINQDNGAAALDYLQNNQAAKDLANRYIEMGRQSEETPLQTLQQKYYGWNDTLRQTPGKGQQLYYDSNNGFQNGNLPGLDTDLQDFWTGYSPWKAPTS